MSQDRSRPDGYLIGTMDRTSPLTGSGPETAVDDTARFGVTTDASVEGNPEAARRDLVAAVLYYEGTRELFGVAASPPRLGKYTLERILGAGAFGTVILGRNPDTEGEVAIKILRTGDRRHGELEAVRLRREAQALARLAHPNIVPVYDAGVADQACYVVMRRISGTTLRQAQDGKAWRDVVDLYVAAARGLAAVHGAGLIHRDFKADNVLVGVDGQVMLADFGLACLADAPGDRRSDDTRSTSPSALAARLTRTGETFGTPAYMAPEAIENAGLGPHSDLFSFAASLFEALYGVLPFEGDTLLALYLAATRGDLRPRPGDTDVPLWLDIALRGALRADPLQRPPSADALIAALDFRARERADSDERARRTRRKRFTVGLGLAALAGVTLGAVTMQPLDSCAAPEARIDATWSDRQAELQAAVEALDDPHSVEAWTRIRGLLDAYVAEWAKTFEEICRATVHEATQSQELFDTRVACLDQRHRELGALVGRLQPVSEATLVQGLLTAARLDRPVVCATATRTPSPTDEQRRELVAVQVSLAEARVLELAGDYAGADVASAAAVRDARNVSFAPALAESLITRGRTRWLVHAGGGARDALMQAVDLAEASALDGLAADASSLLTKVAATELSDAVRGDEWARQSQRKLTRIDADPGRHAELLNNRGLLAFHVTGDLTLAADLHRQALALRQQLPGEVRLLVADSHENLGNVLAASQELDEALTHYRESQRLAREVLGDAHPRIFDDIYNQAVTFYDAGDYPQAESLAEEALAGYLRAADGNSGDVADAHLLLATILELRRQLAAGLAHARLAARILLDSAASPGKQAIALERIGSIEREGHNLDAALSTYERALELLGDDRNFAAERVAILVDRASTLTEMKRTPEALRDCDLALEIADAGTPALARYRAAALRAQGRALLRERRFDRARASLEEALALLVHTQDPPSNAEVKFLLAQALDDVDRARAAELAQESLVFYRSVGHEEFIRDIVQWIDTNQLRATP